MDVINMKLPAITIMLTACGAPGASTCIHYFKKINERKVRVVGVDSDSEVVGRFLSDSFFVVPEANEPDYISKLHQLCIQETVDCLVVSSSYEVEVVARNKSLFEQSGIKVAVSDYEPLKIANNKKYLYSLFSNNPNVNIPQFCVPKTLDEFVQCCTAMGYPDKTLCFKPSFSKGSRGFRYLTEQVSRSDLLINYKPDSKLLSLNEFIEIFKNEENFPELLLMEAIEGEEIDTMALAYQGEPIIISHKTRDRERGGIISHGGHCRRPQLDESVKEILKSVRLSYNVGIQFKGNYLIEINPRLSTFLYTDNWNEPYFAVKLALGESSIKELKLKQEELPQNLRMIRYYDQVFYTC